MLSHSERPGDALNRAAGRRRGKERRKQKQPKTKGEKGEAGGEGPAGGDSQQLQGTSHTHVLTNLAKVEGLEVDVLKLYPRLNRHRWQSTRRRASLVKTGEGSSDGKRRGLVG